VSAAQLSYAVVTPARDECDNLRRLARCLAEQTVRPSSWIIVDDGSTDGTPALVEELSQEHPWIRLTTTRAGGSTARGGPIVRAFHLGLALLDDAPDVVVKLDADVSMGPEYFERILAAFAADSALGIASGSAYEQTNGVWRQIHTTGTSVWGAARAYRWSCLQDVLPLEERMGWDGIDEFRAKLRGWRTGTIVELPFRHHRREGGRDGAAHRPWLARGRAAHYMGYRGWYLALRALHHARRDRAALAMIWAYADSALRRESRYPDAAVREHLRRQQSVRNLLARRREALGKPHSTRRGTAPVDLFLVCSAGGHLLQLHSLREAWEGFSRVWVVASFEKSDVNSLLSGERVFFAHIPTARNVRNLVRNGWLAWTLLRTFRPSAILTTGSAVAVPFAWIGRLMNVKLVYVESLARTTSPSLTCKLVAPVADRVYVQWPTLLRAVPGARFVGTVFSRG
jgi:biofilm PGA synthesis N-glycosyltransferase PgaC